MPTVCLTCLTTVYSTAGMMRNASPVTTCPCCGGVEFEDQEEYDFLKSALIDTMRAGYTLVCSPQGSSMGMRMQSPSGSVTASFPLEALVPGEDDVAAVIRAMVGRLQGRC